MMIDKMRYAAALLAVLLVGSLLPSAWAAESVSLMDKDELKAILSDAPTYVLDVRTGRDWNASEFKIERAHRADPGSYADWSSTYPKTATLVLYCA